MLTNATYNQLANIDNPYQGNAKRVLCLCSAGLLRSPTVAAVLNKEFGYNTRAAGLSDYALIPLSIALIYWADEIVVMELSHKYGLEFELKEAVRKGIIDGDFKILTDKIIVLDIEDRYKYMEPKLQELILVKYKEKTNGAK